MVVQTAQPFQYHVPWKSSSLHLGGHRGNQRGLGFDYRGNLPLVDYPDARRIDIRQTLRDPYEQVQVRLFNQDNITPLFAVCDLSASMHYRGRRRKLDQAIHIAASVARSASDAGDQFGLVGYDRQVVEDFSLPLGTPFHSVAELLTALGERETLVPAGEGILEVAQYLSQSRALVFWISDFHMPLRLIEQALSMLSQHQVVPIVLWDEQEYLRLPRFGFGTLIDPETGQDRTVFFRDALRRQFIAAFEQRRHDLQDLFLRFDSPALFLHGEYHADALTHYFEKYFAS
ncbi:DUF58 domain-containing protein [Methylobacillus flagellatus]|uniref:DUF58 domain-containing protein n=1 Tax=Methylobacillus flagellatus TaxID=405 RepID=UPI0010F7C6A4|nr:DUF58 domain-containing protein [Methylobacillus flagellatus]